MEVSPDTPNSSSATAPAVYPKRPKFYANQFCRLLTKSAAAQDLGPEACWLLTIVVHQEHSKWYGGPVTYYNDQLMEGR